MAVECSTRNRTFIPFPSQLKGHAHEGVESKNLKRGMGLGNVIFWQHTATVIGLSTDVDDLVCTHAHKHGPFNSQTHMEGEPRVPYPTLIVSKVQGVIAFSCVPPGDPTRLQWIIPRQRSHKDPD